MPSLVRSLRHRAVALLGAAASLTLLVACADEPTGVRTPWPAAVNASVAPAGAVVAPTNGRMLACATSVADSATAVIGPRGGVVGVAGSALVVPAGAVPHATAFTFVVPASPYVAVEVRPATGSTHYSFKRPVAISVSYARCAPEQLPSTSVGAWWVDTATLQQLGVMAGIDDRAHERLTFITDHLSGYIVAY